MKLPPLPADPVKSQTDDVLQKVLLDRVVKLRKLNTAMNEDPKVQRAQDALELAKLPFKKAKSKWKSEIEVIETELKSRGIKHQIVWDDIYEEE